jgi:antitoxin (DNA-binding transcriptional repressor) of toxin-antitoxin stability system
VVYTLKQAKANLPRLIEEACDGKDVTVGYGDKFVKLVACGAAPRKRLPGRLKGKISYSPDAFDPLTRKERKALGFE